MLIHSFAEFWSKSTILRCIGENISLFVTLSSHSYLCPSLVTSLHCTSSHLDGRRTLGVGDFSFTETDMITIAMIIFIINVTKMIRIVLSFIINFFISYSFLVKIRTDTLLSTYLRGFSIPFSSRPLMLLGAIQVMTMVITRIFIIIAAFPTGIIKTR